MHDDQKPQSENLKGSVFQIGQLGRIDGVLHVHDRGGHWVPLVGSRFQYPTLRTCAGERTYTTRWTEQGLDGRVSTHTWSASFDDIPTLERKMTCDPFHSWVTLATDDIRRAQARGADVFNDYSRKIREHAQHRTLMFIPPSAPTTPSPAQFGKAEPKAGDLRMFDGSKWVDVVRSGNGLLMYKDPPKVPVQVTGGTAAKALGFDQPVPDHAEFASELADAIVRRKAAEERVAAALEFVNGKRPKWRPLDPKAADWTDDDVLAEARRLGWDG